jgi:hypothetical protein
MHECIFPIRNTWVGFSLWSPWFSVSVHVHMAVWWGTFNYVITVCTRISWGNNKVNLWKAFWKSHGISHRNNTRFQVWFTAYWETLYSETAKTRQEITTSSFVAVIQHPSGWHGWECHEVVTTLSVHFCISQSIIAWAKSPNGGGHIVHINRITKYTLQN